MVQEFNQMKLNYKSTRGSIENHVSCLVGNHVWESVSISVFYSVRDSIRTPVFDPVYNSICAAVRNSVWHSIYLKQ